MNVALSPVMAKRIQAHGVSNKKVILIPNGIHPSEIGLIYPDLPKVEHWRTNPLKLLFIGRLNPVKGVDILLESLRLLRQKEINVSLTIIGIGRPKDHESIASFVIQHALSSFVKTIQSQPRNQLAMHYADSHLVVVPSRDEALPTVVLEAMACGRPVVGTNVSGIDFLIQDGMTGIIVAPNSPSALANALEQLNDNREKMAMMANESLKRAQQFDWKSNIHALEVIL
jgi:glycosyltransferase involved in cell wall biosynthesis